jgi:NAD dependent epimerase/dehydratase family enzyme
MALGELSQLLLASNRIVPTKLTDSGYRFTLPKIEEALESEIG